MNHVPIKVEIVAPVHNRKAITLLCLKSLSRITDAKLHVHTIIVDDGSTDGTSRAINAEFPDVEVIRGNGDLWFTEGTNVGVRAALKHDPDYVLMINDDAVFDADFLRYMVETAENNPRSIVGPLLLLWDTPHKLFQTAPVWDTAFGGWRHWDTQTVWTIPDKPWKVDLIVGNCVLVPAAAFRECGLMDSKRYPNFGDAEFTPRLKRRGWDLLIEPRARVFCQPNTPPPTLRRMGVKQLVSALILNRGNNHNLRRRLSASLDGAPTKIQGVSAFLSFIGQLVFGAHRRGSTLSPPEEPLSKTFASAIVDERPQEKRPA